MKYNAIPTQCEALPYGEVEDYTVNIQLVPQIQLHHLHHQPYPLLEQLPQLQFIMERFYG
jgi:hypothetical protein